MTFRILVLFFPASFLGLNLRGDAVRSFHYYMLDEDERAKSDKSAARLNRKDKEPTRSLNIALLPWWSKSVQRKPKGQDAISSHKVWHDCFGSSMEVTDAISFVLNSHAKLRFWYWDRAVL